MKNPSLLELLEAGVHFGHQTSRWHPKMKPYLYGQRGGVHIIDLEKTQAKLTETLAAVADLAAAGKTILFVTTKPQAAEIVKQAALSCGMPYVVDRWIGGLFTNFTEIKRMITRYVSLKEQQVNGDLEKYTKKERLDIAKELTKKDLSLAGLSALKTMPEVLFAPALQCEKAAVTEARATKVTVIGIADSNANPEQADFAIPGNDDAVKAIKILVNLVAEAINEGKARPPAVAVVEQTNQ